MNKTPHYFVLCLNVLLFLSCTGAKGTKDKEKHPAASTLTVAAAANVQFAMKEIELAYETAYDTDITVIVGSTGKLTAQIQQGAPYDLLIAADMKYPETLYAVGQATTPPKIYALGGLVLWTMNPAIVLDEQLTILTQATVQKIAIANPKNAPYGAQAINAFNYFGIHETIKAKLVYAESIAQTNQYIFTKNCEVGVTAKSVVLSPEMQGKGHWIAIPSEAYQPISQGVVITKYGAKNHGEAAKRFYDFLFSKEAGAVLEKYGYVY